MKKVLLMGKRGAGKTSMRSIIFANVLPKETKNLRNTIDIEDSNIHFLGGVFQLWDCGGQDLFMQKYLEHQRSRTFSSVKVLIFVFDVESGFQKDLVDFLSCLRALQEFSPSASVICLIHKMDLIDEKLRDSEFQTRQETLMRLATPLSITCFKTSIWDETLYKAWCQIVSSLIPNVHQLNDFSCDLCNGMDASEVMLLEHSTFLIIAHAYNSNKRGKEPTNPNQCEQISNIIKRFKVSCNKFGASGIKSFEVRNEKSAIFFDSISQHVYVMVITGPDVSFTSALVSLNVMNARRYFEANLGMRVSSKLRSEDFFNF